MEATATEAAAKGASWVVLVALVVLVVVCNTPQHSSQ